MSQNQMLPVWMTVDGTSMSSGYSLSGDVTTDAVKLEWEDNVGIQVKWTGTPTGTLAVQVTLDPDNMSWETLTFSPSPDQPSGSAGHDYFEINQSSAAFVRLKYTRVSGTGSLYAKIALKSV